MNKICNEHECTGCMGCYNICPKQCIHMEYNRYGELQPIIDEEKCIHCGMCRKLCPSNNVIKKEDPKKVYAAWSKDDMDRQTSTSGGIASIIYQEIIKEKGVAFGTYFNKDLRLVHTYTEDLNEVKKFKGSKYCQSNIEDNFKKVKEFLCQNRKVAFVGTPCQISGLNRFLEITKTKTENLITIDLICHGVPSQQYLTEYINSLENSKNKNADSIAFRQSDKYVFSIKQKDKIFYSKIREKDLYLTAFQLSLLQRDSCMECKYTTSNRVSDITIGDFWGIKNNNLINEEQKKKGISLVLINTNKGSDFFGKVKENIICESRELKEAVDGNSHLRRPSQKNEYRNQFRMNYKKGNFTETIKKILKDEMKTQKKQYMIMEIKKNIKKIVGLK